MTTTHPTPSVVAERRAPTAYQAIRTRYLPATNHRPSRIKAECDRGSIVVSYDTHTTDLDAHIAAVDALVARFVAEDNTRYGTHANPWARQRAVGGLPDGSKVHVYIGEWAQAESMAQPL